MFHVIESYLTQLGFFASTRLSGILPCELVLLITRLDAITKSVSKSANLNTFRLPVSGE